VACVNVGDLVLRDALVNWARNLSTIGPAVASTALMLLLAGLCALGGVALHTVSLQQAKDASLVRIYLRDDAGTEAVAQLEQTLRGDPSIANVTYISKDAALSAAGARPGLAAIVSDAGGNPLPAELEVTVRGIGQVANVGRLAATSPAVDAGQATSYDAETYARLQDIIRYAGVATLVVLGVLAAVTAAVTANAIRAGAVARAGEVRTMRLVGASSWMVRAPFMVEGALTGLAAAVLAGAILVAIQQLAAGASGAAFAELLPGVSLDVAIAAAVTLVGLGVSLGSASSVFAIRGMRV